MLLIAMQQQTGEEICNNGINLFLTQVLCRETFSPASRQGKFSKDNSVPLGCDFYFFKMGWLIFRSNFPQQKLMLGKA